MADGEARDERSGPPAEIVEAFRGAGQEHVLRHWHDLDDRERQSLLAQLEQIDLEEVRKLAALTRDASPKPAAARSAAPVVRLRSEPEFATRGKAVRTGRRLLAEGKVGVFLVAGGQGTRLNVPGPKGCVAVGPLSGKTLYQLHAEKLRALGTRAGRSLPWYVMTSDATDGETRDYFEEHGFFGLRREDVLFIRQRMNPALDDDGKLVLERPERVFLSPNGHGGAYEAFGRCGGLEDATRRGVEHLFYFQVDNPLTRIADPLFIGLHALAEADMSLKVLRKTGPEEKVGVVALEDDVPKVIEYSDFSEEESALRDDRGELVFWAASIAIHVFRLDFFRRFSEGEVELPHHVARKKVPTVDAAGKATEIEANKYERFVFDALPHTRHHLNLEVRREEEFAPVKNRTGIDSLESAQELLVDEHRRWLRLAGIEVPGKAEVSPLAALEPEDLAGRLEAPEDPITGDVLVEPADGGGTRLRTV